MVKNLPTPRCLAVGKSREWGLRFIRNSKQIETK